MDNSTCYIITHPHCIILQAGFKSELLLWPLFLYLWMASMLLSFIKSVSLLVLSVFHHSILLLLAGPWFVTSICTSLLLTGLHVALYLLLMVLVVGVVTILTLKRHKVFNSDTINGVKRREAVLLVQKKRLIKRQTKTMPRMSGRRDVQQG